MLFRERPSLAPELLGEVLGQPIPRWAEVRVEDGSFPKLVPSHRADRVTTLLDDRRRAVLGVIVEVQRKPDPRSRWTWPLYWAALRAKHRCRVILLVVAMKPKLVEWASRVVAGTEPNVRFTPLILGPAAIPWITDHRVAERSPELAVLSTIVHGNERGGLEVAAAAIAALARLDAPQATLYHDLVQHSLDKAARAGLEALMDLRGYQFKSKFVKKHDGAGVAAGEAKGRAEALLAFLRARGLAVTDAQRDRILSCTDLATLDRWIARAAVADSADGALG